MPTFLKANGRLHHFSLRDGAGGRAVVFVNSLGTDLRIWDDVIDRLPADYPVLTYDKSGHGLTASGAVTIADFAADLADLMDALGLDNALICGVSVGGMIAQALAATRPDLVAGLVLCNTGFRIGTAESWSERIAALDEAGLDGMADGILERWFSPRFRSDAPDMLAGYRMMLTRTPQAGYRTVCAAIRDADLGESTRSLTCPTLCVAGADDLATPPDVVGALAASIQDARIELYASVGHLPCIEAPDRLADDILKKLESLP
jgi:3-oxoadipate enol-lactonase